MEKFCVNDSDHSVEILELTRDRFVAEIDGRRVEGTLSRLSEGVYLLTLEGNNYRVITHSGNEMIHVHVNGQSYLVQKIERRQSRPGSSRGESLEADSRISAPMPGKLLKIFVKEGDQVKQNQRLFILEAMKMENEVHAPRGGIVRKVFFEEQAMVSVGQPILEMEFKSNNEP